MSYEPIKEHKQHEEHRSEWEPNISDDFLNQGGSCGYRTWAWGHA